VDRRPPPFECFDTQALVQALPPPPRSHLFLHQGRSEFAFFFFDPFPFPLFSPRLECVCLFTAPLPQKRYLFLVWLLRGPPFQETPNSRFFLLFPPFSVLLCSTGRQSFFFPQPDSQQREMCYPFPPLLPPPVTTSIRIAPPFLPPYITLSPLFLYPAYNRPLNPVMDTQRRITSSSFHRHTC